MLVARFRSGLVALVVVLVATPAAAQLIPGWDTKQFTFERIDAERIRLMREVEVNGVGGNAGQQIFADELEWNTTTGEFTARGNVLLASQTARLSAESVVFNTKSGLGTFYTASGLASLGDRANQDKSMFGTLEPDIYFWGETIEKIGPDKYRLHKGGFTTCVQPTPRWDIVSGSATINLGDYAILRNAVVRVKDVPVFYLPALYYPIQDDDRATGFLLPTYGRSSYAGQSLSNAFFWAINRSQDLTLLHDWYTKTGQGGGGEYRYLAAPGSEGNFRAYWLSQKAATFESNGATTTSAGGRSYEMNGGVAQVLPVRHPRPRAHRLLLQPDDAAAVQHQHLRGLAGGSAPTAGASPATGQASASPATSSKASCSRPKPIPSSTATLRRSPPTCRASGSATCRSTSRSTAS